jgi:hypothetical protein
MNYLALHIDIDFLVGTICADENTHSFTIKDGIEDFFWLYFYNDPYHHIVSFGKENQKHFSNCETNYYGNFFDLIENENNTFSIGEYKYQIIELLRHSKLIDKLKKTFNEKTHEKLENIPTLLTFSLSVSELAKQKLVEYLNSKGFNIISYTIPLSELACFFAFRSNKVNFTNGNIVAFLEASNSDLHLMTLMFSTDYFMLNGKPETKKGLGIDPRKRALLKYVVNKIGTMGILSEQEKETEYKIMEPKADEWLLKLDLQTNNCPVDVSEALSKMPNAKKRVLLFKDKIAEFTGSDIQLIIDNYSDYINRNINQTIAAIFLLGNCFQNDILKKKFEYLIGADKLFFYTNNDIHKILSEYPKIDITRYASEEARIKERAKAEELKLAEQRAFEDRQRKEREMAAQKAATEQKAEENRKEAKKLFDRAVGLEKEGKLEDARINTESAIALELTNREYKQFLDDLKDKIKNLNDKNELYKKYLSNADKLLKDGELENALEEYEAAKFVFDNAEILAKIIEVKRLIKSRESQKILIEKLISQTNELIQNRNFESAKIKINEILSVDSSNVDAKKLLLKINEILQKIEFQFKTLIEEADTNLSELHFEFAINKYKEALRIYPNDDYCLGQLKVAAEKKSSLKPPPPPPIKSPKTKINGMIPPPPIPIKDKPLSNGLSSKKDGPPPPPSIAPKSGNKVKIPPPPPPVPKKNK